MTKFRLSEWFGGKAKDDGNAWIVSDPWCPTDSLYIYQPQTTAYSYPTTATTGNAAIYNVQYNVPNVPNEAFETANWYQSLAGCASGGLSLSNGLPAQGQIQQYMQYRYVYGQAYQYSQAAASSNWNCILSSLGCLPPETAEEKAARAKRKAASLRAESLLFTILTPSQVKQYTDDACFDVEVNGRVYRLHCNSRSGNVVLLENGKPKFRYCAHPKDAHDVPIPDVLVSQLLMLKSDEQAFLKIANRTVLR